jgi:hypothetical protein
MGARKITPKAYKAAKTAVNTTLVELLHFNSLPPYTGVS